MCIRDSADTLPCRIYLISEDPDGLCGINQEKNAKALQARYKVIKPIRDKMENKYQWCIAAVPGVKWAKKVFPGERASRAVELLWEAILKTSRCLLYTSSMTLAFLLGHTLNFAVNILGTYVHTSRLQYIEFFGKFFEDGGREFVPLAPDTKYTVFK